ncbi:MAG: AAA family ATPase, partial [Anaerolineales bacterium]|nr:AAA family ATPase [Anaerolineales bacterium]
DGQGRTVDFRNTVLIMTSNLGTEFVRKAGSLGFLQNSGDDEERASSQKIQKALRDTFRPEFINRIDEIITFSPLSVEDMKQIVDLQMKEVQERLSEKGIQVLLTENAREWLATQGYDTAFGARPLNRALQKFVESPLSKELLAGKFKPGTTIEVDVDEKREGTVFKEGKPIRVDKQPEDVSAA